MNNSYERYYEIEKKYLEALDEITALKAERDSFQNQAGRRKRSEFLLNQKNQELRDALRESMEWNWLDADMPDNIRWKCEKALQGKGDAVIQS